MTVRTRFAPSPTGPLHLGHAFSAMLGFDRAMAEEGEWLLRIEDIDRQRSRPEWERQIGEDLAWLGLWWPEPVMRQSERGKAYAQALDRLWDAGLLYPCTCSRADVIAAATAPQEGAPLVGPDGVVYPGTCRHRHPRSGPRPGGEALRLDMAEALARVGERNSPDPAAPVWREVGRGPRRESGAIRFAVREVVAGIGDVVLARRGWGTSYHLAVVVDDAAQGITEVVRGEDLFEATTIHVILQRLLDLPTPLYRHHKLIRDEAGRRLAKREDAKAIRRFRDEGATPAGIRRMVGLDPSLAP